MKSSNLYRRILVLFMFSVLYQKPDVSFCYNVELQIEGDKQVQMYVYKEMYRSNKCSRMQYFGLFFFTFVQLEMEGFSNI